MSRRYQIIDATAKERWIGRTAERRGRRVELGPPTERLHPSGKRAAALAELLVLRDEGAPPVCLVLPWSDLTTHGVNLPGVPRHRRIRAAGLRLEERLPRALQSSLRGPLSLDGPELIAACLSPELESALEPHRWDLHLLPEALAVCLGCHSGAPPDGWTVWIGLDRTLLALFRDGTVLRLRSLSWGSEQIGSPAGSAGLEALTTTLASEPDPGLLLFTDPAVKLGDLELPAEPRPAPAEPLFRGARRILLGQAPGLRALPAAQAAEGAPAPRLIPTLLACGLLLLLLLGTLTERAHRAEQRLRSFRAVQATSPVEAAPPGSRLVQALGALSRELPPELDLRLERIALEGRRLELEGTAAGFAATEALRVLARQIPGARDPRLARSDSGPDGRVEFLLEVPLREVGP